MWEQTWARVRTSTLTPSLCPSMTSAYLFGQNKLSAYTFQSEKKLRMVICHSASISAKDSHVSTHHLPLVMKSGYSSQDTNITWPTMQNHGPNSPALTAFVRYYLSCWIHAALISALCMLSTQVLLRRMGLTVQPWYPSISFIILPISVNKPFWHYLSFAIYNLFCQY